MNKMKGPESVESGDKVNMTKETTTTTKTTKTTTTTSPPQLISRSITEEVYQNAFRVEKPEETDVLCGRGAPINMHPGNVVYRQVVKHNKPLYQACEKFEKYRVAQSIVDALEYRKPSVRFLEQQSSSQSNSNNDRGSNKVWTIISKEKAIRKTIQALRERDRRNPNTKDSDMLSSKKHYIKSAVMSEVATQVTNCFTTKCSRRKMEGGGNNNSNQGAQEDWQVLFRHLLPEATSGCNKSSSLPPFPSPQYRMTSGIIIGKAENKGKILRQQQHPATTNTRHITTSTTAKIETSLREKSKTVGGKVFRVVPMTTEKSKKPTSGSNLSKQKSLQRMLYNSLSMDVNEMVPCEFPEEDDDSSCQHHHNDSSSSLSPNCPTPTPNQTTTSTTQYVLIPESTPTDQGESNKATNSSSNNDRQSLMNTSYSGDGDDGYSITSDFGLNLVNSGVGADTSPSLTKHSSTNYSIGECRGTNPFNPKEDEQWMQDIDFEALDVRVVSTA